jgi:hypothetical protein
MNPERWEQANRMYHSAPEVEPGQREPFLREACTIDQSLFKGLSLIDDSGFQDLHFYELACRMTTRILESSSGYWGGIAVSPDCRTVLCTQLAPPTL